MKYGYEAKGNMTGAHGATTAAPTTPTGPLQVTCRIQQVTAATWPVLALSITAYTSACVLVSTVLFHDRIGQLLGRVYAATGSLIQSTLVGGLVSLLITGPFIIGAVRCRVRDIGWSASAFLTGMLVTIAFWLVMQGVLAVVAASHGLMAQNASWNQAGGRKVIGGILGQILGNALVEETVFRGFFLPQLYLKAVPRFRHSIALFIAILSSSVLYSVTHLPNLLFIKNMTGFDLLAFLGGLVALGLLFAGIYLITGNLFIAVGLHALINTPAPVIDSSERTLGAVWFGMTVLLLFAWPRIPWRRMDAV